MIQQAASIAPTEQGVSGFTLFSYIYRDGSNYKQHGEIGFRGTITKTDEARLKDALDEGEYFIACQVRVPDVFFTYGEDSAEDDHSWHEFTGVEPGTAATDAFNRTIAEFVDEVVAASAAGWQEFEQKLAVRV